MLRNRSRTAAGVYGKHTSIGETLCYCEGKSLQTFICFVAVYYKKARTFLVFLVPARQICQQKTPLARGNLLLTAKEKVQAHLLECADKRMLALASMTHTLMLVKIMLT